MRPLEGRRPKKRSRLVTRIALAAVLALIAGVSPQSVWAQTAPPDTRRAGQRPTIVGTAGKDNLLGTPGNDVMQGLGGSDTISPEGEGWRR